MKKHTLDQLEEMLSKPSFSFDVSRRSDDVGGGWNLKLFHGKEEMGGGVYEPGEDGYSAAYAEGFEWLQRVL